MTKKALITGITGQDGSYLAELLLIKGYDVHGVVRRSSSFNRGRIEQIYTTDPHTVKEKFHLHYGDLSDSSSINSLVAKLQPDELYHLGAQSHVGISFQIPEYTADVTGLGTLRLLEAVRHLSPKTKFYQASSSELYGKVEGKTQNEQTKFYPRSPYATAKLYAYWITKNYRESYQMFACNGILFNHESPRRGENFVSRKITLSIAKILRGELDKLYIGNLEAKRDWGYAPEYVEGMWRIMQHDKPDDYVLATGKTHSVREFVEEAFRNVDINIKWQGSGLSEKGIDINSGREMVAIDAEYFRPNEVDVLCGDFSKAENELGWWPKTDFKELVKIMVRADSNQS
ncbi:MAG: GDP-mannose 4,6-dehydratase [Candidatus Magasanikbacteria bacterium RIFOXYD2_FULL_41_14]|uniref:GDP-mannose 4,6-dehydratase n=1 Tax=Candidatus Magasanikbacteria bacterium RIFOXYD2_FULL_41_14 TaxID=1798709 RepID=A0A1F6PGB1_9BACT|nr:MAG: GDP-mannose 4,6-dehydratase [Candidatus Magasanikbacteria bacterium RIFOXYD2_FULL_41_14]